MVQKRKKVYALLFAALLLTACGTQSVTVPDTTPESGSGSAEAPPTAQEEPQEEPKEQSVQDIIDGMTLEEKAAQLFLVRPEDIIDVGTATAAKEKTKQAIDAYPVGGFIYFGGNLQSEQQVQEMLQNTNQYSEERIGLPAFLSVDEEGGTVARIAFSGRFDVPNVGDMAKIGASGDPAQAKKAGETIGAYLTALGFNLDFAPVADVYTNPENTVVKRRAFGSDPELVADMAIAVSDGLAEYQIASVYKHFPGHGATSGDTHNGYAYTNKTLEELRACELIPFERAIAADADFIMAAHISLPNVTGDDTPASLSHTLLTDVLREDMGYDGIIVTDAMNMGAVTEQYTPAQAAVQAITAGADIILMPADFQQAYQGVLDAVESGALTEARIDESLARIVKVKLEMKDST